MNSAEQITSEIKAQVKEIIPDANVILFGSQANNTATEESDWDILIISENYAITPKIKQTIHDKIFPLSVTIGAFINLLLVTKKDWQESPSYYSLRKNIELNSKII